MKKVKWITIIIILVIIILPTSVYGYVKYKNYTLEKETCEYLQTIGYKETEILDIKSKIKKLSLFTAEVTFKDEPDITYDYKKDGKKIIQISPTIDKPNYKFKHLE